MSSQCQESVIINGPDIVDGGVVKGVLTGLQEQWCSEGYVQVYAVYPLILQWALCILPDPNIACQSSVVELYTISINTADGTDPNI